MKRFVRLLWIVSVTVALFALVVRVLPPKSGRGSHHGVSPWARSEPRLDREWSFLHGASERVPSGATFTVTADEKQREMSLFMMSVGLLPQASPLPSSYYGEPRSLGEDARYRLHLGTCPEGVAVVATLSEGCVIDREGRR